MTRQSEYPIWRFTCGNALIDWQAGMYRYTTDGGRTWTCWQHQMYQPTDLVMASLLRFARICAPREAWQQISPGINYRDLLGFEGDDS